MAKKKSERYRDRYFASVLQVRDESRILGNLTVKRHEPVLIRNVSTQIEIRPKRSEPWLELSVDNSPVIMDAINETDRRYQQYFEKRKRERRPRTITQDKGYIRFPDFVIRAEKLLPVVVQAIEGGMKEIQYSSLRRLLGM
ncbi:hypothetical protein ACPV6E_06085 [Corynebacterium propinquum]|uniref:hypothetical protein n=1 Tax=Corynebacterium propinquum TaxID=43769 RepID=UPI003C81BB0E